MGRHRPSKTDRKKLKVKPEVLFAMLSLRYGKPDSAVFGYMGRVGGRYIGTGVGQWIKETPEGAEFAKLIMQCGDAKRRAPYWYRRWDEWHKEQKRGATK